MKKFYALTLAMLLVFSMAAAAMAVDYSYIMGGRYYAYFSTIDGDRGFNPAPGVDAWNTVLGATVKQKNTWASIKFIADSWNQKIYHSFGIDNIAGTPWSIGFDSHDSGTTNLGQQFMGDLFNDFKADPYFNTCDMAGSFNVKYITDTFEFRGEAKVYDGDGSTGPYYDENLGRYVADEINEMYAAGLVFKNDLGKFYFGGKYTPNAEDPLLIVGADLKLDNIGLKLDFWSDKSGLSNQGDMDTILWGGGGHQTLQATVEIDKLTGQFVYSQLEKDLDDTIGLGVAYKLTDKFTLGTKYFMVDDKSADDGIYDVYAMYDVGAWDIKFGTSNAQYQWGHCGPYNEGSQQYKSSDAIYNDDGFFYVGVHFEF